MVVARIQCRDIVQVAAACFAEDLAILHRGLLECLEAVGRKAGAEHIQALEAAAAEFRYSLVGVGLQPLRFAEA